MGRNIKVTSGSGAADVTHFLASVIRPPNFVPTGLLEPIGMETLSSLRTTENDPDRIKHFKLENCLFAKYTNNNNKKTVLKLSCMVHSLPFWMS